MRSELKTILTLLVCTMVSLASLGAQAQQPNVVLFLVDDMGWADWERDGDLNTTGSDLYETPNMLRLAQSGVVFDNAYAASSVCSPTRAAIMTGKTPARLKITDWITGSGNVSSTLESPGNWVKNLPDSEITLAESLKAGGYNTGFFGKWHLGESGNPAENPLNHGFDVNIGGARAGSPPGGYFAGSDGGWNAPGLESGYAADDYLSDVLSDHAADYIEANAGGGQPFFTMLSHYLVHTPRDAPQDLVDKYNAKISTLEGQGVDLGFQDDATYAAMLEKMDDSLGKILDKIEDPNGDGNTSDSIRDNTLILFASDNGGLRPASTDNRPLRDGKGSHYEGGIRTPLIASWTGNSAIQQDRVEDARTSAHDLYATVLDAVGLLDDGVTSQTPASVRDGKSFLSALEGGAHDRGFQYFHYPHEHGEANNGNVQGGSFVSAIRKDQWKMIYLFNQDRWELYDLETDIGETIDLVDLETEVAAELSFALRAYLNKVDAQMPVEISTGQPVDLPPALLTVSSGDFNDDGSIDVADWIVLSTNLFRDVSTGTGAEAFALGDNNLDGMVDRYDFAEFKDLFDAVNGSGAFDAMLAGVPEPSTLALLILGGLMAATKRQR